MALKILFGVILPLLFLSSAKPFLVISELKMSRETNARIRMMSERYKKMVPYSVKLPV
ncbi:MAG: hypothetical protein WC180_01195 [Candidatus Paceibacterota bacterium]